MSALRLPRLRLRCPSCGGTTRLPRDLRQRIRCPCGAALHVALVHAHPHVTQPKQPAAADDRHRPPRDVPPSAVADVLSEGLPIARPNPVYRGRGDARERAWGAAVDIPVEPGDKVFIVAKTGRTWHGLVAEPRGTVRGGGHLVTLRGNLWQPDPEPAPEPAALVPHR